MVTSWSAPVVPASGKLAGLCAYAMVDRTNPPPGYAYLSGPAMSVRMVAKDAHLQQSHASLLQQKGCSRCHFGVLTPELVAGDTLSASSSHGEATVPQAAEHQQQLAQAESTELSMKLDSSNAELMASGQAKGSRPDSEPDADAQSNSSRADSLAADQASGAKKRAVDDDYSVSSAKTRGKAKRKGSPVKTGAASAATPVASQTTLADATAASHGEHGHAPSAAPSEGDAQRPAVAKSTSSSSLGSVPSFLPPKPKPGGNKAKAAAVPDTSFAVEQPQVLAPLPQPPVSAVKEAAVAPPRRPQPQTQACCNQSIAQHSRA